jgi:proton-translocating NADH-quinone oxidoreductase chain N
MTDLVLSMPEIFVALTLVFVLLGELTYHGEKSRLVAVTALLGLGAAFIQTLLSYRAGATSIFDGAVLVDGLSLLLKLVSIVLSVVAVVSAVYSQEIVENKKSEYIALILSATLALLVISGASDLLLLFVALQFLNVSTYFLAGFSKNTARSTEAGIKYLVFSSVAAAFFVYGVALLFSITGKLSLLEVHQYLLRQPLSPELSLVVFGLLLFPLLFQMAAFPFYLWAPDVIEGAPTPAAGFISVATRLTGFTLALRIFLGIFSESSPTASGHWMFLGAMDWTSIISVVAGITMLIGGFLALRQKSAKRLVACLMIAQSGQLLMGLIVQDETAIAALLYQWMVDLFALTGIFAVLGFYFDHLHSDQMNALQGMLKKAIPESICLIFFLCCLVGVPPAPSFISKFGLIESAFIYHKSALALVSIISMGLSITAAGKLAFSLIGSEEGLVTRGNLFRVFLTSLALPILAIGVFSQTILDWAGRSLDAILW